jgi:S1-C subfamily serine protease
MDRMVSSASALAAMTLAVAGCGGSQPRPAARSPEQRLDLAVVGIDARVGTTESLGSGIVIDPANGLIVTAAHTVWGARTLKIATALGVLHGRIVARAPCDDLAVLELAPGIPGLATLPAAPPRNPGRGELLRAVGRRRTFAAGAMATLPVRAAGAPRSGRLSPLLPVQPGLIPLDSPLVPELSGGPVLDAAGRLVGMAQAPGLAVPWSRVRALLAELRRGPRSVYVGWAQQYRCVHAQHAYARATHPGFRAIDARLDAPVAATRIPGTQGLDG